LVYFVMQSAFLSSPNTSGTFAQPARAPDCLIASNFPYLTDVQDSAVSRQMLVPFTQFASDPASGELPNYSLVTPNLCDDAHNCGLDVADAWLKKNIAAVLISPKFSKPGYQSTRLYQHQSTLRLMLEGLGITTSLPGAAATAPAMWEFFTFPPPP
jgi:hypothetical protein